MTDTFDTIHVKMFVIYDSRDLSVSSCCTNIREGASPTEKRFKTQKVIIILVCMFVCMCSSGCSDLLLQFQ